MNDGWSDLIGDHHAITPRSMEREALLRGCSVGSAPPRGARDGSTHCRAGGVLAWPVEADPLGRPTAGETRAVRPPLPRDGYLWTHARQGYWAQMKPPRKHPSPHRTARPPSTANPPHHLTFRRTAYIIVQQKYQHPESLAIRSATAPPLNPRRTTFPWPFASTSLVSIRRAHRPSAKFPMRPRQSRSEHRQELGQHVTARQQ